MAKYIASLGLDRLIEIGRRPNLVCIGSGQVIQKRIKSMQKVAVNWLAAAAVVDVVVFVLVVVGGGAAAAVATTYWRAHASQQKSQPTNQPTSEQASQSARQDHSLPAVKNK